MFVDDCYLNANHTHAIPNECVLYYNDYECWDHYDLVSRCNITLGQRFYSNVVANINIDLLKTN